MASAARGELTDPGSAPTPDQAPTPDLGRGTHLDLSHLGNR